MSALITVIAFICVFGLLVFVHELGHFFAAKIIGVTVKSFAFGFPPTLYSKRIGETEYKINAIPLGGYVSLLGEYDSIEDISTGEKDRQKFEPGSLMSKKPWQVIFIMFSGVTMNIILAVILFWLCFVIGFQPIVDGADNFYGIKNDMKVQIEAVEKDSPAYRSGVTKNDIIQKVDGRVVHTDNEVVKIISQKSDPSSLTTVLTLSRNNEIVTKKVTAYKSKIKLSDGTEENVSRIGISLKTKGNIHGGFLPSFLASLQLVKKIAVLTFDGVLTLFKQLLLHFQLSNQVSGPVGIVVMTNYFVQLGVVPLLQFAAILSISLAIFNILPIPGLDGGQIFVTILEIVSRKKFSNKTKGAVQLVGFAFIMFLFLIITVKDISNFGIIKYIMSWFK